MSSVLLRYVCMLLLGSVPARLLAGDGAMFAKEVWNGPGLHIYRVSCTDSAGKLKFRDTLGFFTTDIPFVIHSGETGMFISQWQPLTRTHNGWELAAEYTESYEGYSADDGELFLHPPRTGRYRVLQFCPYPLFRNEQAWTWELAIGGLWATPPWYPVKGVDTFYTTYSSQPTPATAMVAVRNSVEVKATTRSVYGKTTAKYYLSYHKGIIAMELHHLNGDIYRLDLIDSRYGADALHHNQQLLHMQQQYNSHKQQKALQIIGIGR